MDASQVSLSFPRWLAILSLYVGVPAIATMTLALIALVGFQLTRADVADPETLFRTFVLSCVAMLFLYITVGIVRARHALFTCYTLTTDGILIQRAGEQPVSINWSEIESGIFRSFAKTVTLYSSRLARPIVLMNNAHQHETASWLAARDLALARLAGRIDVKWI